jgi:hypothetical protein
MNEGSEGEVRIRQYLAVVMERFFNMTIEDA